MEKKKVFLSFPMRGLSSEEIIQTRDWMASTLKDTEIPVDNMIEKPEGVAERLYCLGEAIKKLGECDAILLHPAWKEAHGCIVEYTVALEYGLDIYYA